MAHYLLQPVGYCQKSASARGLLPKECFDLLLHDASEHKASGDITVRLTTVSTIESHPD
jgi:hypothetical protein